MPFTSAPSTANNLFAHCSKTLWKKQDVWDQAGYEGWETHLAYPAACDPAYPVNGLLKELGCIDGVC